MIVEIQPHLPNRVQAKYLLALANPSYETVLFYGGAGSGKTVGQATAILDFATRLPSNHIAVVRKTAKDLKATIQQDFFDFVHPSLILSHNKEDQITEIQTGSIPTKIFWRGLDDTRRWGGTHFGQIFCEEASELEVSDYTYLITRLRHKLDTSLTFPLDNPYLIPDEDEACGFSVRRFLSLCYNPPEDPNHWLYELQREGTVQKKPQRYIAIHSRTHDNWENLDSSYKSILENLPTHEYNRMVLGQDSAGVAGDPVTYMFRSENLFKVENLREIETFYTGHDLGWAVPNKVWGYYVDGSLYVTDLLVKRKMDLRQFLKTQCPEIEQQHSSDAKYVDFVDHQHALQHNDKDRNTSAEIMRKECGRNPQHSFSRPEWRGELINELLRTNRLWIADHLQTLINCLTYGWVRGPDGSILSDGYWEHIGDSLGYLVWGLFKGRVLETKREGRGNRREQRSKHIKESLEDARRANRVQGFNYGGTRG